MADSPSTSFIPKRGPAKQKRRTVSRQVYIFTYASYVLIFASLIASAAVFLYGQYINQQLNNEITALDTEIESFSEADMQTVMEFNNRLVQAAGRLEHAASVVAILDLLETVTIEPVQYLGLTYEREDDEQIVLTADVDTTSFDATIFQRGLFESNTIVEDVVFTGVELTDPNQTQETLENFTQVTNQDFGGVRFLAEVSVDVASIPLSVVQFDTDSTPISDPFVNDFATSTDEVSSVEVDDISETDDDSDNQVDV
jgi:hypothetical protein